MFRRAHRVLVLSLLLAAAGCGRSSDYGPPWFGSDAGADQVYGNKDAGEYNDAGTATGPSPDASSGGGSGGGGGSVGGSGSGGASANDGGTDAGGIDNTPDASVEPIPPTPEPVPDCPLGAIDFDTPPPAPPSGQLAIDLSAWLQPVGFRERALIEVLDDQGQLDTSYDGQLGWSLPAGVEIVDATPVTAGQAEVTFLFTQAGTIKLEAGLPDDPRTGSVELVAYDVKLPVWELEVDPVDLDTIYASPGDKLWVQGVLTIDSVPHITNLRLHGGSSRYYRKKSFRFNLIDPDPQPPSYGKKLILRAEFNDKSQLRNWLSLRMVRDATGLPTPRSKFVHFRVNDRYYGVMHNVERVDEALIQRWGMSAAGSLYEADPVLELASPGGNLTPLSPDLYPMVYQHHAGSLAYMDLQTLIEETLTLPDNEFSQVADMEIRVDEYIHYLAALAAIQDHDQVRKNYYLYRDPDESAGWLVLPWDLDLTLGHLWSEANDVFEEQIVTDADIFVGAYDPDRGEFYNQLTERVLRIPEYRARFRALVEEMLVTTMSRSNADLLMSAAIRCMTPDIVADSQKRADDAEYQGRVTEILDYLDARLAFVQSLPKPELDGPSRIGAHRRSNAPARTPMKHRGAP